MDSWHGLLPGTFDNELFPLEDPPILRENIGGDLTRRFRPGRHDDVMKERKAVLPVVFGRRRRVIGMRVIETEHGEAGGVGRAYSSGAMT
jgi:hypothetical protein